VEAGLTELRIEHVSLTFPARHGNAPTRALEPTDLIVGNNDFVTILGPSGCGKYALLRIVAGLDRPTSGRVLSMDAKSKDPARIAAWCSSLTRCSPG